MKKGTPALNNPPFRHGEANAPHISTALCTPLPPLMAAKQGGVEMHSTTSSGHSCVFVFFLNMGRRRRIQTGFFLSFSEVAPLRHAVPTLGLESINRRVEKKGQEHSRSTEEQHPHSQQATYSYVGPNVDTGDYGALGGPVWREGLNQGHTGYHGKQSANAT